MHSLKLLEWLRKIPLIDAYYKIDESRSRFKKFFWSAVLVIGLATILEANSKDFTSFPKIVIAVSTSFAAAALIEIFSGIRDVWVREQTQKEFREFFGCTLEDNSVAIVIPRFPMQALREKAPQIFDVNLNETGAVKKIKETNEFLAYADVKAVSDLLIAFSKADLLRLTEIRWDDEILDEWENRQSSKFKTFIIVGLYSNLLFFKLQDLNEIRRLFKIVNIEDDNAQFQISKLNGEWYNPHSIVEGKEDFALLAKIHLSGHQNVLIMGGISAKGTEHIGEYIRQEWHNLYSRQTDDDPSILVQGNEFAMSISIPLQGGKPPSPVRCRVWK